MSVKRSAVTCLGVVAMSMAGTALAKGDPLFAVVDAYADQLIGTRADIAVAGPKVFTLARRGAAGGVSDPVSKPVATLAALLKGCSITNASYGYDREGYPRWVQGRYSFECATKPMADRAVRATVTTSLDGKRIDTVETVVGGEVSRMGPAPMFKLKGS